MPASAVITPTKTTTARKPRLLMAAFACHPKESMETRIGWRRALLAAESCETTVLVGPRHPIKELEQLAYQERGTLDCLDFVRVEYDWLSRLLCSTATTFLAGYRHWNWLAYRAAERLHQKKSFDVTHQATYCGYREPGYLWRINAPFIWGPVGGTQDFPRAYLPVVSPIAGAREMVRSALNWWQMRCCTTVRRAAESAAVLKTATQQGHKDFQRALGVSTRVELETGLDCAIGPLRNQRDSRQPFRLLWAGRLRPWKGFPLLVQALQQLPRDTKVEVRVLGVGPCLKSWQKLAERSGVAEMITWVGWGDYDQNLPHYRWADAFAFTSLRDTSGTGLLESLAMGTPILGINHQGAADIMTPDCAVPLPATSPAATSKAMAEAIVDLSSDSEKLLHLSRGAQHRAEAYDWGPRVQTTRALYQEVAAVALAQASSTRLAATPAASSPKPNMVTSSTA